MNFCEITPYELGNAMQTVGKDWLLITVEDKEKGKTNAMTASWGCMGVLWNKCVCVCFVRPQRYTYRLLEDTDRFSICVLGGEKKDREALAVCGRESGRDCDKLERCGLTVEKVDGVSVISEAETVLVCRKLYADDLKEEKFIDKSLLSHYEGDFHRAYVCEIEKAYVKNTVNK